jgi:hypothetical protein
MYLFRLNKVLLIFVLQIFFIHQKSKAISSSIEQDYYIGFHYLYNFQFQKADSLVKQFKNQYPVHPLSYIFAANCCWWKMVSGDSSQSCKQSFNNELNNSLKYLDAGKQYPMSNWDIFNYINVFAYKARLDLMERNYFKAISHVDALIEYQKMSLGKEFHFPAFNITSGLYNYSIPYTIKHYPYFIPALLFLPDGDMKLGLKQLTTASLSSDVVIQTEANYFLMQINLECEKNYLLAGTYAEILTKAYPDNLLYRYYYFDILLKQNLYSDAKKEMETINIHSNNKELTSLQKKYFVELVSKKWKESQGNN